MHIAVLTFDGFNELDSLIALGIPNRIKKPGWRVTLSCPTPTVTSMNGVTLHAQSTLSEACAADAVLFGSGIKTREIANYPSIMGKLKLALSRQLIGAQCSGTLMLAKLGYLKSIPACTNLLTKPWVQEAGVQVLNQPFYADGNVATWQRLEVACPRSTWPPGSSLNLKALTLPSRPCTTLPPSVKRNCAWTVR